MLNIVRSLLLIVPATWVLATSVDAHHAANAFFSGDVVIKEGTMSNNVLTVFSIPICVSPKHRLVTVILLDLCARIAVQPVALLNTVFTRSTGAADFL